MSESESTASPDPRWFFFCPLGCAISAPMPSEIFEHLQETHHITDSQIQDIRDKKLFYTQHLFPELRYRSPSTVATRHLDTRTRSMMESENPPEMTSTTSKSEQAGNVAHGVENDAHFSSDEEMVDVPAVRHPTSSSTPDVPSQERDNIEIPRIRLTLATPEAEQASASHTPNDFFDEAACSATHLSSHNPFAQVTQAPIPHFPTSDHEDVHKSNIQLFVKASNILKPLHAASDDTRTIPSTMEEKIMFVKTYDLYNGGQIRWQQQEYTPDEPEEWVKTPRCSGV